MFKGVLTMKKRVFLVAGVAILSAAMLAACSTGGKDATKPVTYTYVFSTDPTTLDYTVSGTASTKQITGNVIDGLLENDQYGNLIPSVAEDWTVSNGILMKAKNMVKSKLRTL